MEKPSEFAKSETPGVSENGLVTGLISPINGTNSQKPKFQSSRRQMTAASGFLSVITTSSSTSRRFVSLKQASKRIASPTNSPSKTTKTLAFAS